jgi:hypothetical protein
LADKHLEISQLNEQMILIMKERDELMSEAAKKREAPSQKSEENIVADTTQMTDGLWNLTHLYRKCLTLIYKLLHKNWPWVSANR